MKKVKDLLIKKESYIIYILSIIYSLLLIFGFSYEKYGNASLVFKNPLNLFIAIVVFIVLFLGFKVAISKLYLYFDKCLFKKKKSIEKKKIKFGKFKIMFDKHPFIISMIIMLICWLPYIVSFYPAIMSPDPSFQIKQFFGIPNKYSTYVNLIDSNVIITNHHPVIHTLLLGNCLKIGTLIGNDNFGLFIYSFIQILVLSSVLSYTIKYMKKIGVSDKFRLLVLALYSLVPMFPFYSMSAVKDVIFTSLVILYIILVYDLFKYKDYEISIKKVFYMILLMILLVLFRNNGIHMIMLSFPLLIWLCKNNWKKLSLVFILILGFNTCYNKVVLPYFKITPGSVREQLSIPFQQTARFVKYDFDKLSDEDKKKIDKVLGINDLANRYNPKLSDPVKNKFNRDTSSDELMDYFGVWVKCFFKDPALYVDATINNVYGYFYPLTSNWYIYHNYNDTIVEDGFDYHFIDEFSIGRRVLKKYGLAFPSIPIISFISNIGFNVWVLFMLGGYLIYSKKKEGIVILLPSLVLLLVCVASPANTYFRYAMPYIFAMPIMICMVLDYVKSGGKNEKEEENSGFNSVL